MQGSGQDSVQDSVQGTVYRFDSGSRAGVALLDDGTSIPFGPAAFDAGGLRLLRPGQRVRLRVESGRAVLVTLYTLTDPGI